MSDQVAEERYVIEYQEERTKEAPPSWPRSLGPEWRGFGYRRRYATAEEAIKAAENAPQQTYSRVRRYRVVRNVAWALTADGTPRWRDGGVVWTGEYPEGSPAWAGRR